MNASVQAMYAPNTPSRMYIQRSPNATVANTTKLTKQNPIPPLNTARESCVFMLLNHLVLFVPFCGQP
jgi:hypothetical protein